MTSNRIHVLLLWILLLTHPGVFGQTVLIVPYGIGPSTRLAEALVPEMARALGRSIAIRNMSNRLEGAAFVANATADGSTILLIDANGILRAKETPSGAEIVERLEIVGIVGERSLMLVVQKGGRVAAINDLRVGLAAGGHIAAYGNESSVSARCANQLAARLGIPASSVVIYPDPNGTVESVINGKSLTACLETNPTWNTTVDILAVNRKTQIKLCRRYLFSRKLG